MRRPSVKDKVLFLLICAPISQETRANAFTGRRVRVAAGGFHLGRKDVLHAPITAVDGALLFLRGARPEAELLV